MSDRGPWGSGPRGGRGGGNGGGPRGPWGGGRGGGGDDDGPPPPRGPNIRPPDFEEMLRRSQDRFRRLLPGGRGSGGIIAIAVLAVIALWLASGFYRVEPDEVGVVLRFGAYNRTTYPGLNYHLPRPMESVQTPKVTRINHTEIGFRNEDEEGRPTGNAQVPEESLMLTGDENIVDINCTIFWVIKDAKAYLFNIRAPEKTVKSATESALREVIGEHPLAMELSEGRQQIESETLKLSQQLLDIYGTGVEVTQVTLQRVDPPGPVIAAFRDVQAALADQARLKNEAESYRNGVVPKAKGDATKIEQGAEAYKQQVIAQATGDATRFDSVYQAFRAAEDVTRLRLYIVTMEQIFEDANKVILDRGASGQNVLPYLPLPSLQGFSQPAPAQSATTPSTGGRQ
ncbi:MAG TPA: FtsH protease activity modulator HflK [Stellaceae bacterium]|jgi:membrane protease subunit HflK|nr:FtsH protease activity modulator HflK [Stellaceae bacterium]